MTKQIITGTKKQQQPIGLGRGNYAQIPNNQLPSTQQTNKILTQKITGIPYTFYKTS
jgi:hypothetical protein